MDAMRIGIVGTGIAGLSSAFYLSAFRGISITMFEQAGVFGGRANVTSDGEHCPRLFLSDYAYLLNILGQVRSADGQNIRDGLSAIRRYCHVESSWVEVSHLYFALAAEISLRRKLKAWSANRRPPLVADELGGNTNSYGSLRNFSIRSLSRMLTNLLRSRTAFALAGSTDRYLIDPWVRYLAASGVEFRSGSRVEAIDSRPPGVVLRTAGCSDEFDAVVITAFAPDAAALLARSGMEHGIRDLGHTHCVCFTLALHPDEKVLTDSRPALYSRNGINIVVQPRHRRCVVLCTRPPSTAESYVMSCVRSDLNLEHDIAEIRVRDNQRAGEAVYAADYVPPERILRHHQQRLYFAGSYVTNTYPIDSGEGAARSAFNAVCRIRADFQLVPRLDAVEPERGMLR